MNYWDKRAETWDLVGHPLRPNQEDLDIYKDLLSGTRDIVSLGATEEFKQIPGVSLFLDQSTEMLKRLGDPTDFFQKLRWEDWMGDDLFGAAICDGGLSCLNNEDSYRALAANLYKELVPSGFFVVRIYLPETRPNAASMPTDNPDLWKWRLVRTNASNYSGTGVRLGDVYNTWKLWNFVHPGQRGAEWIKTVECYKGSDEVYTFPSMERIIYLFAPWLRLEKMVIPSYEDGEYFPICRFRSTK